MRSLYATSTRKKSKKHKYKLGYHTGPKNRLLSRYHTYLINPVIFYFKPTVNAAFLEADIFNILEDFIIYDENNKKTEWVCLELEKIIECIENLIKKYNFNDDSELNSNNQGIMYACKKCGKKFNKKSNYGQHINRKTNRSNGSKTNKKNNSKCTHCKKSFSTKGSLTRHFKTCKSIKQNNTVSEKNNNTTNKNPAINVILFCKDGIENLSCEELIKLLKSNKKIILIDNPETK